MAQTAEQRLVGVLGRTVLGIYFVGLTIFLAYLVYGIWPDFSNGSKTVLSLFGQQFNTRAEVNLILLAMVVGALGGNVHAIRSFASFTGNRHLATSWVWWLVMRPFVGLPLALILYFAVRAGFLAAGSDASDLNPFGIGAVSGLVGMFSDHAARFLRKAFENLFQAEPERHEDPL